MAMIEKLFSLDLPSLIIGIFILMSATMAIVDLVGKFSSIIGKPVRWVRKKNADHDLLMSTIQGLNSLQSKHDEDVRQSIRHDELIKDTLTKSVQDIQKSIEETQIDIRTFAENRVSDRAQSFEIQKKLTESIQAIVNSNTSRDDQISALMEAQKEALADRINQKYKYYISIKGMPEDEVDEFTNLHIAYNHLGGNHSGDAKYDYCMNHLPIIPVEVKLIIKDENE